MASLTRRGALNVTTEIDRIANLIQSQHEVLGLDKQTALKFAFAADQLSNTIENHVGELEKAAEAEEEDKESEGSKTAAKKPKKVAEEDEEEVKASKKPKKMAEEDEEEKPAKKSKKKAEEDEDEEEVKASKKPKKMAEEDEEEKAAKKKSKKAVDETGKSVMSPAHVGFDANDIGDQTSGPLEILAPVEAWMSGHFSQNYFQQLRTKQQAGSLGMSVSASTMRLRRMAAASSLSALVDVLMTLHTRVSASDVADVKSMAGDLKKQLDAVSKVHDACVKASALGLVDGDLLVAADKIASAVTEQIPYLQGVLESVNESSPLAMLEFQQAVAGGSLKELVALGASIVTEAAKNIGKAPEVEKEASVVVAEDKDESEDDETEGEEEEEKASEKKASDAFFGFDLFAV